MSTAAQEPVGSESGKIQPAPDKVEPARKREKRAKPVVVARTARREEQRTVAHVDLFSVLKISVAFYLATVFVGLVAFLSLWAIAQSVGIVDNLEDFIADLLAYDEFRFLSFPMLRAMAVLGLVWVALATTMTVVAAAFYNLFAELLGGVEVTLVEEPREIR